MYLCTACYIVMHISYGSKGSTLNQAMQAVQEQCFLWERVTPFSMGFFTLQTCYMHTSAT